MSKQSERASYTDLAHQGLKNAPLQKGLRGIQQRYGQGALHIWDSFADPSLRKRVKTKRESTLAHLDIVLEELTKNIEQRGGNVFFAPTAQDAVNYVLDLASKKEVQRVVKGKSMTSAEIGMDEALEQAGIKVVETDLGEYIVQLNQDTASHIIAPCIHLDRKQIGRLFHEKLDIPYTDDPPTLTQEARKALRKELLSADMGITGCNIACAETGHISLVSNEGNIRMATTMPKIHVALMGMERVAATLDEHASLLQLLTRGAALQKLSTYVSFQGGPSEKGSPDGPEEFHLVIIDNGRSKILADSDFKEVLSCIRCGACLNICPVYGRIGGHAYNSPYSGPIGAVITPLLHGINNHADLCKGETLCGACKEVCPVENDLPRMLSVLRHKLAYGDPQWNVTPHNKSEHRFFRLWSRLVRTPKLYHLLIRLSGVLQRPFLSRDNMVSKLPGKFHGWTTTRDLPPIAESSFRQKWLQNKIASKNVVRKGQKD
ncbi:LutB/LldF family L-lactate oxidation iron-sulfur protein [Desulfogranum marinum]|uniref:LutB/LldF family L-lactate oxidation iron-sulfur protein n=1 Tax=Desulfogranum marinum TaxID=453220 RepID=UPI0029C91B51|nr:LutB/LldF family L-lactate oxidation iron-sulfur protein [Desulfogranum marinum]